jgi:tetratricopeptide (TPR) repeat protein
LKQIANLAETLEFFEDAFTRALEFENIFARALEVGWQEAIDILLSEIASVCPSFLNEAKKIAARVMSEGGQLSKALEIARSITNPENRAGALIAVTRALVKAGEKEQAREIIEEVWSLSGQAPTSVHCIRCEVVKALAELSEWEIAMQRLESIRSSWYDWKEAIEFLATEAARQGRVDLAKQIAGRFRKVDLKAHIWADLVAAFVYAGNEEEAKKAFERAKKLAMQSHERNEALTYLASVVANLNWIEEAKSLLEAIGEDERQEAISEIVRELIFQSKPELAEIFAAESNDARIWTEIGWEWSEVK